MHLSMRVPWMDRPWDGAVCDHPHANASCVLLRNIGPRRDDAFETANAGVAFAQLDPTRLPCVNERSSWLSPNGYQVTKTHPYAWNNAVSAMITGHSLAGGVVPDSLVSFLPPVSGWLAGGLWPGAALAVA